VLDVKDLVLVLKRLRLDLGFGVGTPQPITDAPRLCFRYPTCRSVSRLERFEDDCGRKVRPNFEFFDSCNSRGVVAETSESIFCDTYDPITDMLLTGRRDRQVREIRKRITKKFHR